MSQPFNQQMDWGEWVAAVDANPCPHTGGTDSDGCCLTCDFPAGQEQL